LLLGIIHAPGYALGGTEAILATGDADGAYPLFSEPPSAYLYYMASFAQAFIAEEFPDKSPGEDYATFPFPAVSADQPAGVTIGADIVVMLHDSPAARSFLEYLAGADSQQIWVEEGGFTSVNRSLPLDAYRDDVARATAEQLTQAGEVRFSAGDSMPPSVQKAWWAAMRDLVKDPSKLDSLLESLTAAAAAAR
jgi:alpha-glucoside transport system substrate-binding protein